MDEIEIEPIEPDVRVTPAVTEPHSDVTLWRVECCEPECDWKRQMRHALIEANLIADGHRRWHEEQA